MEVGDGTYEKRTRSWKRWSRWCWTPTTLLVLGLLSMALLLWTKQNSQRQRAQFIFADALMDLQEKAATAHLWLEEAISGEDGEEREKAWSDFREATRLSEVLRSGGESEHGLIVQPLKDPELQRRAEDVGRLLSVWGTIARERSERPEAAGEGSVLENRSDEIFGELQRRADDLERILEEDQASSIAKSRRLFYGLFLAWSSIVVASVTGALHRERRRKLAEEALQHAKAALETRVAERTTELRGLNEQLGLELGERQKTEEALRESETQMRHLSARLLTAQETERRRIATELHDELGHSLILMKFRLGLIEQELRAEQSAAKGNLHNLAQYIDQVIEDVRRLSRDLRPSLLEDLGLSAALRWLADNCSRNAHPEVVSSISDVDDLFSPAAQVLLYRIIQEGLTNAEKHAHAGHVSLSVERLEDRVAVVVEDDGKGFDVQEAVTSDAAEKGLGLTTMQERARMLGGSLSVWSEAGKGSRITLSVPV